MTRICKECQEEKPLADFATYNNRDGEKRPLRTCLDCYRVKERERQRRYISENRAAHNRRVREYKRDRYRRDETYRKKLQEASKSYYETNKPEVLAKRKERYEESKDAFRPRLGASEPSPEEEFEELLDEARRRG